MDLRDLFEVLNLVIPFIIGDIIISPSLYTWFFDLGMITGIFGLAVLLLTIVAPGIIVTACWLQIKQRIFNN